MSDLVQRLRIKAGVIEMGEKIAWGSDSALMREAADMIERMLASEDQYTPADMADQGAKQFRAGQAGTYTAEDMADQGAQGWRDGYAAALELLNRIIPRIDAGGHNPIDPDIHCCEWTLHRERERIHAEFADALAAHQKREPGHDNQ